MSMQPQPDFMHVAADDAERIAGDAYYTGCIVSHPGSRTVTLYLANAPESVLEELEALHPGVYVIINDAPRPHRAVLEIMQAVMSKAPPEGIEAVEFSATIDGYVKIGVLDALVPMAQASYDAIYGCGVIRVVETSEGHFFAGSTTR